MTSRHPDRYLFGKKGFAASAARRAASLYTHGRFPPLLALVGAALFVLVLSLAGCGGDGGGSGQQARAARQGGGPAGQRRGPSQPPVPVAVEPARTGRISSYYTATATLAAEKEAQILARATGVIEAIVAEEGDLVGEGRKLLKIEDDEYRLRLSQEQANVASLRDRHDRLKNMLEQKLVAPEEYETLKSQLTAAEAAMGLAELNLSYTTVQAPFTGRIVERFVDVGQNVSVGTPLFRIADFSPLLAVVHVPSKEFRKLKPDQPVTLQLDSNEDRLQGRIKLVSPVIDPNSGTIKVTVEIPEYPEDTRPGDFAQVSIVTETRVNCVLVPKIAVFNDQGDQVVFVAADSTAERRVVDVGFQDDENAEIVSGVSEGESIIVKGQRSLKHGAPIKILEGRASTPPPTQRAGS